MTKLSQELVNIIASIPSGKVLSYGVVAALGGSPRAARQVSWLLKTQTHKFNLPWYRVVNSKGSISIKDYDGYQLQKNLLESEGILFNKNDIIDLKIYMWNGLKDSKSLF
jgi:methylated-DNA-protein-cysteine methyltransferase related protein